MRVQPFLLSAAAATCLSASGAAAQVITVAQDRLSPQDELDALSRNADIEFPELEQAELRKPVSVTVRALNKITARYIDIEAPMNEAAEFGALKIVPRFCDKRPPEEFPETTAFLQIYDLGLEQDEPTDADAELTPANLTDAETADASERAEPTPALEADALNAILDPSVIDEEIEGERIFSGWMFASSPALNPLEHPVYDIWVIDCATAAIEESTELE
ncbi:MAG: DUF2155 domain-containing protein [Pseudomonadota bacterium]